MEGNAEDKENMSLHNSNATNCRAIVLICFQIGFYGDASYYLMVVPDNRTETL